MDRRRRHGRRLELTPTERLGPLAVELLAELVAIDSVNPALVPGAAGEAAIACDGSAASPSRTQTAARMSSISATTPASVTGRRPATSS